MEDNKKLLMTIKPYKNPDAQFTIWLPSQTNFKIDQERTALGDTNVEQYEIFTDMAHATHMKTCFDILAMPCPGLKASAVTDHTLANQNVIGTPKAPEMYKALSNIRCLWLAPGCSSDNRFGPICFHSPTWGNEGIIRGMDYNYYWLEVIDYDISLSASRILVTRNKYEALEPLRYNPRIRGGPWYVRYDQTSKADIHYTLKQTVEFNKTKNGKSIRSHTTEFLKEGDIPMYNINSVTVCHHFKLQCKKYRNNCVEACDTFDLQLFRFKFWFTMGPYWRNNWACFNKQNYHQEDAAKWREWVFGEKCFVNDNDIAWESFHSLILTGGSTTLLDSLASRISSTFFMEKLENLGMPNLIGNHWQDMNAQLHKVDMEE